MKEQEQMLYFNISYNTAEVPLGLVSLTYSTPLHMEAKKEQEQDSSPKQRIWCTL